MNKVIIGVVVMVIGSIIVYFFQQNANEKANLKYGLSESIKYRFNDSTNQGNIQQLSIYNLGDLEAKDISIKIKNIDVSSYEMNKYALLDSVRIISDEEKLYFEISYIRLPSNASFNIVFRKTKGNISNEDIEIRYSKGVGNPITDSSESSEFVSLLIIASIYVAIFILFMRSALKDSLYFEAINSGEKILKRKQPFYILSEEKWKKIRNESIESLFKTNYSITIKETAAYKWLNKDKEDYVSIEEWELITKKATNSLIYNVTETILSTLFEYQSDKIYELEKPKNISDRNWTQIKEVSSFANLIFLIKKQKIIGYANSLKKITEELDKDKPDFIMEKDWEVYLYFLKSIYLKQWLRDIVQNSYSSSYKESLLENEILEHLDEEVELVQKFKDDWKEQNKKKEGFDNALNILEQISILDLEHEKPDSIEDYQWHKIKSLSKRIEKYKDIENKIKELKSMEREIPNLSSELNLKLSVIDKVLSNPNFLDLKESYGNIFSKGNFENLKKVAEILKREK